MNYLKKMCILRQIRQGFSGDGKTLSGLIKIEQYGKNLAVEVSVINFAPLVSGEYYCLLSDGKGRTEMLSLRGKSLFNILSDLDISEGFCGIICYVKNEVVPIAYGINGNRAYDWRTILNKALPPVFPNSKRETATAEAVTLSASAEEKLPSPRPVNEPEPELEPLPPENAPAPPRETDYNDEKVALINYYEEKDDERKLFQETDENAPAQGGNQEQIEKERTDTAENGDAESVRHPFKTDPDGYYLGVKEEVDKLFASYPKDETLAGAFSCSEWVRIKGTAENPEYLVGVLYEDGRVRYICYALAAEDKNNPPDEIKNVCSFVPAQAFDEEKGFFVIFQSASSGECTRPLRA